MTFPRWFSTLRHHAAILASNDALSAQMAEARAQIQSIKAELVTARLESQALITRNSDLATRLASTEDKLADSRVREAEALTRAVDASQKAADFLAVSLARRQMFGVGPAPAAQAIPTDALGPRRTHARDTARRVSEDALKDLVADFDELARIPEDKPAQ